MSARPLRTHALRENSRTILFGVCLKSRENRIQQQPQILGEFSETHCDTGNVRVLLQENGRAAANEKKKSEQVSQTNYITKTLRLTHRTGSQQYLYSISPLVNVDMAYFAETFFFLSFFLSPSFHLTCLVVRGSVTLCCCFNFCSAREQKKCIRVRNASSCEGRLTKKKNAPRMAAIK